MSFKSRTGFISNTKTKILIPRSFCCYDVSVVIPVKDNQDGIDRFLREFFLTHKREFYPKEIIIVDNNSHSPITIRDEFLSDKTPIRLLKCSRAISKVSPLSLTSSTRRTRRELIHKCCKGCCSICWQRQSIRERRSFSILRRARNTYSTKIHR